MRPERKLARPPERKSVIVQQKPKTKAELIGWIIEVPYLTKAQKVREIVHLNEIPDSELDLVKHYILRRAKDGVDGYFREHSID